MVQCNESGCAMPGRWSRSEHQGRANSGSIAFFRKRRILCRPETGNAMNGQRAKGAQFRARGARACRGCTCVEVGLVRGAGVTLSRNSPGGCIFDRKAPSFASTLPATSWCACLKVVGPAWWWWLRAFGAHKGTADTLWPRLEAHAGSNRDGGATRGRERVRIAGRAPRRTCHERSRRICRTPP